MLDKTIAENEVSFYEALYKVQKEITSVKKEVENPFFHSKYADLPAVWEMIGPILKDNWFTLRATCVLPHALRYTLRHKDGFQDSWDYPLPDDTSNPQKTAAALTYARRVSLGMYFQIITESDDDGNKASGLDNARSAPKPSAAAIAVFKPKVAEPAPKTAEDSEPDPVIKGDPDLGSVRAVIKSAAKPKDFDGVTSWGFVADDVWYNTANPDHADILNKSKGNKMPVIIEFKRKGKYKYVQNVRWVPTDVEFAK